VTPKWETVELNAVLIQEIPKSKWQRQWLEAKIKTILVAKAVQQIMS